MVFQSITQGRTAYLIRRDSPPPFRGLVTISSIASPHPAQHQTLKLSEPLSSRKS